MSNAPLMPKATAVWLLDNTALTFDQVADFTKMHPLEVRAIADGDAAQGIKGSGPDLQRPADPRGDREGREEPGLSGSGSRRARSCCRRPAKRKGPRYTPVSRRHERPSAILWLLRNHPELKDAQIMRLVGTTKTTIASVRDRTHWNTSHADPDRPGDARPVLADRARFRSGSARPRRSRSTQPMAAPPCCRPPRPPRRSEYEPTEKSSDDLNVDAVFAKLKTLGGKKQEQEEE